MLKPKGMKEHARNLGNQDNVFTHGLLKASLETAFQTLQIVLF